MGIFARRCMRIRTRRNNAVAGVPKTGDDLLSLDYNIDYYSCCSAHATDDRQQGSSGVDVSPGKFFILSLMPWGMVTSLPSYRLSILIERGLFSGKPNGAHIDTHTRAL